MPTFDYTFSVDAPIQAVRDFHNSTDILKRLTPPPVFVQIHDFGAMREGMQAQFTMWFGPVPVRWHVEHINVSENGFTDVQLTGPLAKWAHTHTFSAESPTRSHVHEHIEYTYPSGWRGVLARLVFGKPGLIALFIYRRLVTRWSLRHA